jgi:hypothetical protein
MRRQIANTWSVAWKPRSLRLIPSSPIISVVGDTDLSDYLPNTLATRNGNFDLPELVEYLFRAMTFSWHFCLPSFFPLSDLSDGHV